MKLLRAVLSIALSLSLIVLSPGLECSRLLAQVTGARGAAAPVSPVSGLPGAAPLGVDPSAASGALDLAPGLNVASPLSGAELPSNSLPAAAPTAGLSAALPSLQPGIAGAVLPAAAPDAQPLRADIAAQGAAPLSAAAPASDPLAEPALSGRSEMGRGFERAQDSDSSASQAAPSAFSALKAWASGFLHPRSAPAAGAEPLAAVSAQMGGVSSSRLAASAASAVAEAPADAPAVPGPAENIASWKGDVARRTESAPSFRPGSGRPRIVVAAAKRLPYTPYSLEGQESAKSLGVKAVNAVLDAAGLAASEVEGLVAGGTRVKLFFGSVDNSDAPNIAREVAVEVGLPSVPGTGICKNCGTSLETAALGMSELISGAADLVIVGGAEAMSRFPQWSKDAKLRTLSMTLKVGPSAVAKLPAWQKPIGYAKLLWAYLQLKWRLLNLRLRYAISEGLSIAGVSMIETAEALAGLFGISRDQMDWFSYHSQRKAAEAAKNGEFAAELVPYTPKGAKGPVEIDSGIRFKNSRSGLRKLKGVLGTSITPAQASQMTDGAAAMVLTTEEKARELGLVPLAYLEASNETGVDPNLMGLGPAYSIPQAVKEAGISLRDVGIFHINEAFAPQILAVLALLGIEPRDPRVNPQGGAIARGHPLAASGAGLGTTTIFAQRRHDHRYGVCSACIGGGEGASLVFYKEPHLVSRSFREGLQKRLEARGVSAPVRQRIDEEINGLPTVVRLGRQGLEGYPSVWKFLEDLNAIAGEGSAASYSALAEAMLYGSAMAVVRARLSPGAAAFLDETLRKDHPEFVAAYEREFGEKTFNGESAAARWLALESYKRGLLGKAVPLPEALESLFAGVSGVLGDNVVRGAGFATLQEAADFIGEKAGPSSHVHNLKEASVFGAGLAALADRARADIALFGQAKHVFKNFKVVVDADGVATVAISHEPVNSLNAETVAELERLVDVLGADSKVKSVVFTGDGDKFIVGADINLLASAKSAAEAQMMAAGLQKVLFKLESLNKPVVMALNGQTLGGGLELAMAGHERIASGLAELGQPEINLGLNPGAGGTQRLPRLVGLTKALEMMTKGEAIDAFTAKQYRLVERVVAPADLLAEAHKRAVELGAMDDAQREKYFRTRRTLKRRVRLNLLEMVGVHLGVGPMGPVAGLGAGIAAPFFLGAWWTAFTGIALGLGLGGLIASKFTRNKWAVWGGRLAGAAAGYFLIGLAPFWVLAVASALVGLAWGLFLLPGNGFLIKRQAASLTPDALKFILPVVNSIIDATLYGVKEGGKAGSANEAAIFGRLAMGMARLFTATFIQGSRIKPAAEPLPINRIAVIGAGGVMGSGIAQFALQKGIPVTANEFNETFVQKALARIRGLWDPMLKKDKMEAADVDEKMSRAMGTADYEKVIDSDPAIVIEAIRENEADKTAAFSKLGAIIKAKGKKTILASNTSALSITKLAEASGQRSRFIGMHFFNPVHEMKLVEVILPDTAGWSDAELAEFEQTKATAISLLKKMGKVPVVMHDRPGFAVNRTLGDYVGEANRLVLEGASIAQIDAVMKKMGFPMGPLELTDHISLSLGVEVGHYLSRTLPHLGTMPGLMGRMVQWGYSGKQWGKNEGFYTYNEEKDKKTGEPKRKLGAPNYDVVETAIALEKALAPVADPALPAGAAAFHAAMTERVGYLEAGLGHRHEAVLALRQELNASRLAFINASPETVEALKGRAAWLQTRLGEAQKALADLSATFEGIPAGAKTALRQEFAARRRTGISDQEIEERLMFVMANEAARILGEGVVESALDIDIAMLTGTGIGLTQGGLLRYADKKGLAYVVKQLERYSAAGGGTAFEPAAYLRKLVEDKKGFYGEDQGKAPGGRGGLGALLRRLFAWAPALGAMFGAVLGGAISGSGKTGLEREAASMMKTSAKKPEAFIPDFYRGALDLTYLSKLDTKLDAEHQARVDAIKELIRIGLRTKGGPQAEERAAVAALEAPSPALAALLSELELDPAALRQAIVDPHFIDKDNDVPAEVLQRMSDMGLFRLKKPKEYGGLGLHQKEYGQVLRAMGGGISGSLGALVSAYNTIGTAPLLMFATPEQKEKYLRIKKPVAFGLTEPLAGTDLNKLGTTATLSPDGKTWRLSGEKIFITGITDAGVVYLVSGHTVVNGLDLGPSVFISELPFEINETWETKKAKLAELAGKGMRITPFTKEGFGLMMIRGTDQGFIQMDGWEIPAENVLGPLGKGKIVPLLSLNAGRAGFGPYVSEAASWMANQALEWAADRKMFDMYSPKEGGVGLQGYMEYPVTKLGRMQIRAAAMEDAADLVSAMIDDAGDKLGVAALSAAVKVRITDQSWDIAQDALELGGGHALIKGSPNGMELAFRDSWIARIVEGVNAAMAQFVHLIGGGAVAKEMATMGGIGRFVRRLAINAGLPFFVTDRGSFPLRVAKYIQKKTAQFAFRFGVTAQMLGQAKFGRRQNTLIRAYNVLMDIFTLAAVEKRLLEDRKTLTPEAVKAREAAIEVLKFNIGQNMRYISPKGHPIENLERTVGEAFVEAELARKVSRENVVDAHMDFLHDLADAFQRRIAEKSGTSR